MITYNLLTRGQYEAMMIFCIIVEEYCAFLYEKAFLHAADESQASMKGTPWLIFQTVVKYS